MEPHARRLDSRVGSPCLAIPQGTCCNNGPGHDGVPDDNRARTCRFEGRAGGRSQSASFEHNQLGRPCHGRGVRQEGRLCTAQVAQSSGVAERRLQLHWQIMADYDWEAESSDRDDPDELAEARALASPQGQGGQQPQENRGASLEECEAAHRAARGSDVVGRKKAHKFLAEWRDRHVGLGPNCTQDLSDGGVFNWKVYLGQHPDRGIIFDHGRLRVDGFGIRQIAWIFDTNKENARVDFVALRSDRTAMRLHPSSNMEAVLVLHEEPPSEPQRSTEQWLEIPAPPALAAPQGKGGNKGRDPAAAGAGKGGEGGAQQWRKHYVGASTADLIPTWYVGQWLTARSRGAEPGTFAMNVSESVEDWYYTRGKVFTWFLWFNKVPQLAELIDLVDTIWLAKIWRGNTLVPGFWFRTTDGIEYFVTVDGKHVAVQANPRHVEWNL